MALTTRTIGKLADLRLLLSGKATMLIVLQDNPDPDAFADKHNTGTSHRQDIFQLE